MKKIPIIELGLSIVSLWWAFMLYNNNTLFSSIPDLYNIMNRIASQNIWAIVFFTGATLKILGILNQHTGLRRMGLMLSFFLYGVISASFILSNEPLTHGTGTHFVFCIFALYSLREVRPIA